MTRPAHTCAIAHPPAGHVVQRRYWSVSDERTVRVVTRSLSCSRDGESPLWIAKTSQDNIIISKIAAAVRKAVQGQRRFEIGQERENYEVLEGDL